MIEAIAVFYDLKALLDRIQLKIQPGEQIPSQDPVKTKQVTLQKRQRETLLIQQDQRNIVPADLPQTQ